MEGDHEDQSINSFQEYIKDRIEELNEDKSIIPFDLNRLLLKWAGIEIAE